MAWTSTTDRSAGYIVTPTDWNIVEDNLTYLKGYTKATAKAVNTTVAATDLLNAEITIAAGILGTTGRLRLTASGDLLQNSGGTAAVPRFQFVFGGTTIIDTGTGGSMLLPNSATRGAWKVEANIANTNATGTQETQFLLDLYSAGGAITGSNGAAATTGQARYGLLDIGVSLFARAYGMATSTLDTTTSKTLVLNVINGSANALCETKLYSAVVELL